MINFLWRIVAWFVCLPSVTAWLIERSNRTPYTHITGADGSTYMGRWWLFNPYRSESAPQEEDTVLLQLSKLNPVFRVPAITSVHFARHVRSQWLPSIRIHHIRRPDLDRHLHDHPWNARTIVLRGGYVEERRVSDVPKGVRWFPVWSSSEVLRAGFDRKPGYTGRLMFGAYHRIREVAEGGAWTLFITWRKRGTWGFNVNGVKIPWRQYLGVGTPEEVQNNIRSWGNALVSMAENSGQVITIEREPLQPLAMRNSKPVVYVRRKLAR